ncbi:glycerophosphodiester phosphodiesterase family protein [Flavobacterium lipolyticum]|uniref:Glycerophosphodiester phosphodiesterase family protein n=1 Tax=Flavobacterium lipolyticum TaxID=2893754 RepID=A0ABS8LYF9_9FLAO|nr:glycerophosphodiester phosphodiesterase family protein [Flavobacterium sp. F-126]MCC9017606.1 glycerophosphodiester phosphodiesterase family protein [Flavobacterium sp. F-126]
MKSINLYFKKINQKGLFFLSQLLFFLSITTVLGQEKVALNTTAEISLLNIFSPDADLSGGIIGEVLGNGNIQIEVWTYDESRPFKKGTLIYKLSTTATTNNFAGTSFTQTKNSMTSSDAAWLSNYPDTWETADIKRALWAIDKSRYDKSQKTSIYNFLSTNIKVNIFVFTTNATFSRIKVPGIGVIGSAGGNLQFDSNHFCYNLDNSGDPICTIWSKIKSPNLEHGSNLVFAAHRGYWGYDLGNGPPENTPEAIKAALKYTKVIESDITRTKDNLIVVSHDYYLPRLTNYSGPDTDYIYDKTLNELKTLKLRKRNGTVSDNNFITFSDLLDEMIANKTILTIDIKSAKSRNQMYTKECIARCDYDPLLNPTNADRMQKEDYMLILRKCIEVANTKNALKYVAFKVTYTYEDIVNGMPADFDKNLLSKILYFPVLQPGGDIQSKAQFIDTWYSTAGNKIMAFETNFKSESESTINSFSRGGKLYGNLFEYTYKITGLRPGIYSEEAMGPKGNVDRWAQWNIKDMRIDVRGDHYFLNSIPYFNISVLTTDRPDIWSQVQSNF